jgi:hypothetical protein
MAATLDDLKQILEKMDARAAAADRSAQKQAKAEKALNAERNKERAVKETQAQRAERITNMVQGARNLPNQIVGNIRGLSGRGVGNLVGSAANSLGNAGLQKLLSSGGSGSAGGGSLAGGMASGAAVAVGIIYQWAKAMTEAAPALRDFGREVLEGNRRFAEASATMANLFANQDAAKFMRDIKTGEATSGSTEDLMKARAPLEDIWSDIDADLANIKNSIAEELAGVEKWFLEQWAVPALGVLQDILQFLGIETRRRQSEPMNTFAGWLNETEDKAKLWRPQRPVVG